MVDWLVGWSIGWFLVGWLAGWLVGFKEGEITLIIIESVMDLVVVCSWTLGSSWNGVLHQNCNKGDQLVVVTEAKLMIEII